MNERDIIVRAAEILKENGWRRSKATVWELLIDCLHLDHQPEDLGQLRQARYELDWDYQDFSRAYDAVFGKRAKPATVAMTTIRVGGLAGETEKAYEFFTGKMTNRGGHVKPATVWVPKSQVTYNADAGTLEMPVWLAREKNYMRGQ